MRRLAAVVVVATVVAQAAGPASAQSAPAPWFARLSSYLEAVKGNPEFVEARVHRGFVLSLLGQHRNAAEELRLAASTAAGPQLRYYAELFLGHAEESLGNRVTARDHYRQASALYPQAQSPLLALAMVARQLGDRASAQDAMRQVLALPAAWKDTDPWWATTAGRTTAPRLSSPNFMRCCEKDS